MAYTTINKSSDYFNTKLFTGTGSSNAQTGIGFAPDFLAVKDRNGSANRSWVVVDNVRGATKRLKFDNSGAESTQTEMVKYLDSDGFTLGTSATSNNNGTNFVAHNWKANGQGSSNTVGTINTTYTSANTTAGFSIVSYSGNSVAGATVGHGLGVAPKVVMIKQLTGATNWTVYHASLGSHAKYLYLDATNAVATDSGNFDNVTNANTFLLGSNNQVNASSGSKYIAYCFAEVQGYSKFGSYVGNGNNNGTFVYTGFKPAFTIIKNTTTGGYDWVIDDIKRSPFNEMNNTLFANEIYDEYTGGAYGIDFVSNGFKIRDDHENYNKSGDTYVYMAFGQSLVGSNNIPCTAR